MRLPVTLILGGLLTVASPNSSFAQAFQGDLRGVVKGAGVAIPAVDDALIDGQTDLNRPAVTDASGNSVLANTGPGSPGAKSAVQGYGATSSQAATTSGQEQTMLWPPNARLERPRQLLPLYVSFAALQGLDLASTKMALGRNPHAVETNPLIRSVTGSTLNMFAMKTTAAVGIYYMSERLWKHNRQAAVWTMIGMDIGYGLIAAHNYHVASIGAQGR